MRNSAVITLVLAAALALVGCKGEVVEEFDPWQEIEPGLSYVDSTLGQGALCDVLSFVEVHYTGWTWEADEKGRMAKGKKFESSRDANKPVGFPLGRGRVIQGWEKGLVGMAIGGKRTLRIAPELAYGLDGRPPVVPPATTLVFDVELLSMPEVTITMVEEGDGPVAEPGDILDVNYTGYLWHKGQKGKQFDSSAKTGRPYRFTLGAGQVIAGWDLGLEGMKVGTKANLLIPAPMGYGAFGSRSGSVPPNATLTFDVELVAIEGK